MLEMEWSNDALWFPARALPPGAFRLSAPASPNSHVVIDAPELLRHLQQLGKRMVPVKFDVKCDVWKRRAIGYSIISVDNVVVPANANGWAESIGEAVDPIEVACQ